jgi:predicted permease
MARWLVTRLSKLGFVWARRRLDVEAQQEFAAHLEALAGRFVRSGLSAADAERAARRQLGNLTLVREDIHAMNGFRWLDGLRQDVRYAGRQIRRAPAFAAVVIATLGIGIGGTTAVFSVVDAVLLAPLSYDEPERLVRIYQQEPGKPETRTFLTGAHFSELRSAASSFDAMAALDNYSETGLDFVRDGRAERLRILPVTSEYFQTLAPGALRGPGFDRSDETGTDRIVLSDTFWRDRFGGDLAVLGTTVRLSGRRYEVIGVAPEGFEDPIIGKLDGWVPYGLRDDTAPDNNSLSAVGRLRRGIRLEQGRAELAALSQSMKPRLAARLSDVDAVPLQDDLVAASRGPLRLVLVSMALVLVVACVNVANLALVRASTRLQEFALRSALGSGRARLVRQLLAEGLVLASLGGAAGLTFAWAAIEALKSMGAGAMPRMEHVAINPAMLGFAATITLTSAIAVTVAPALRLTRAHPRQVLGQQSRSSTATRGLTWLRSTLATAQVALALTLLAGAAVLATTFYRLQKVDLGFRVDRLLTFDLNLPDARYEASRRAAVQEELAASFRAIPGVTAAGAISRLPATGQYHGWNTVVDSGPAAGRRIRRADGLNIQHRVISGDALGALGIPLVTGRTFDTRDDVSVSDRALVSEAFVRQAFPGVPLEGVPGHFIRAAGRRLEIIGVVGDVTLDPYGTESLAVYHTHRQFAGDRNWVLTHLVASTLPPARVLGAVREAVAALDPELVVHHAAPIGTVIGRGTSRERFALVLMAAFAGVSIVLAMLGLYGVLAYTVRQRAQELGIRLALGATTTQVLALVLRQATLIVFAGLALGTGGALMLGRWLSSLTFGVSPSDPRILASTGLILGATAFVAAWFPARRASRVDPAATMREG